MLVPISLPAGVFANGTPRMAAGRWGGASLVRWIDGAMQPVGGWRLRSAADAIGQACRAMLAWRSNGGTKYLAVASHDKLTVQTASGASHDITPVGFAAGRVDATASGGFGAGAFGAGSFGTPRPDTGDVQDATVCSLDTWGENLVFCSPDDNVIYEWSLDTGTPAQPVAGAPACEALVVTAERFLFALNGRTVRWCDQADNTVWTAAADNQAGEVDLQTFGRLRCGRRVQGGTLLFTDVDVHLAAFRGGNYVHEFDRVGGDCGIVGSGAVVSMDALTVWMGRESFWVYEGGGVRALPSEVSDYVFSDFNPSQGSKVSAFHNSAFGEVWWFYPSGSSNENDRAVSWSYRDNVWGTHELARTCAVDQGVFRQPLACDPEGLVYEHEIGFTYPGTDGPFAQSGPFEVGQGDFMAYVQTLIPDERTLGDLSVSLITRPWPNGAETVRDPITLSGAKVDVTPMFQARQISLRIAPARQADWRWGEPRFEVKKGARR